MFCWVYIRATSCIQPGGCQQGSDLFKPHWILKRTHHSWHCRTYSTPPQLPHHACTHCCTQQLATVAYQQLADGGLVTGLPNPPCDPSNFIPITPSNVSQACSDAAPSGKVVVMQYTVQLSCGASAPVQSNVFVDRSSGAVFYRNHNIGTWSNVPAFPPTAPAPAPTPAPVVPPVLPPVPSPPARGSPSPAATVTPQSLTPPPCPNGPYVHTGVTSMMMMLL